MKKKFLFVLLFIYLFTSDSSVSFAMENNMLQEETIFYLVLNSENELELLKNYVVEPILVISVKKVDDNKIYINCKNISLYTAYDITFNTLITTESQYAEIGNYSFYPVIIPSLSPGGDMEPLKYTLPLVYYKLLYLEVGVNAFVNGNAIYAYALLYLS